MNRLQFYSNKEDECEMESANAENCNAFFRKAARFPSRLNRLTAGVKFFSRFN